MDLAKGTRRSTYALVGACALTVNALRETPRYVWHAWNRREQWVQRAGDVYNDLADRGESAVGRAQREARRMPGVAPLEGEVAGVVADADELPLANYTTRTAANIAEALPQLSQRELHMVEGYETQHRARTTILRRIDELRGEEPWAGYDEQTVEEILPRMRASSPEEQATVADYERHHKQRRSITDAVTHHE